MKSILNFITAQTNKNIILGGTFSYYDGSIRNGAASVSPNTSNDVTVSNWNPNVSGGYVYTMVLSGSDMYLGGAFTTVSGVPRNFAGAFDSTTATIGTSADVRNWNPNMSGGPVFTMVLSGSNMYMGGNFTAVSGINRNYAAAFNSNTASISTSADVRNWNPNFNNSVQIMVLSGSNMYIGGDFTSLLNASRGYALAANATTSAISNWNPNLSGGVAAYAIALSGTNVFLGGDFSTISGVSRSGAAAFDSATDSIGTSAGVRNWNPNTSGSSTTVVTMVLSGSNMYLGGSFTTISGVPRNRAAAFNSNTASVSTSADVRAWNPNLNNTVQTIVLSGADMYMGGNFTTISGTTRNLAAAFNSNTSTVGTSAGVRNWNPNCGAGGTAVYTMVLTGSDMYLGGAFTTISGVPRNRAGAFNSNTSTVGTSAGVRNWNPNLDNITITMVLSGSDMYLGGSFTTISGVPRNRAAVFNSNTSTIPTSADVRNWNPNCNGTVNYMILNGADMYIGGSFSRMTGIVRNFAGSINSNTAATLTISDLRNWTPYLDASVQTMLLNGSDMYLVGNFSASQVSRSRVAAINSNADSAITMADVRNWNPTCNGTVLTMLLSGADMYIGGNFSTIQSVPRNSIAAFDSNTSTIGTSANVRANWNPNCDNYVSSLILAGTSLYIGGNFANIGASARNNVAAISSSTASLVSVRNWNPNCNGTVETMFLSGSDVYLGGDFTTISGISKYRVGAFDSNVTTATTSASIKRWNPNCDSTVYTMLLNGQDMYLGGNFTNTKDSPIAGYAKTTNSPSTNIYEPTFSLSPSGSVLTCVYNNQKLYLGGSFSSINRVTRNNIVAISTDPLSGNNNLLPWNPNFNSTVYSMVLTGSDIYIGGAFSSLLTSTARGNAAAVNSNTSIGNRFSNWNPNCGNTVQTMVLSGSDMYMCGVFSPY